MTQAKAIWIRVLQMLRPELPDFQYRMWFESLIPLSLQGKTLVLEAPSQLILTTIYNNYFSVLLKGARDTTPAVDDVLLVLGDERMAYLADTPASDDATLYPKYTFDTFVVGNSNHFAHAAAQAVAANPGQAYNPLFLHSGVGLGKTHLMHAVGHYVKERDPSTRVRYVTSETFTNEMIQSISTNKNKEFRDKYRNVDVLMVDDIQFIAKKEGVQEEFFHTFNTLYTSGKQIIISSDKPPRAISQLEERLRTRFECGLIADIQQPDYETRMAILKRRAAQFDDVTVDDKVLEFIAERVMSNIRELEGALNRVVANSKFNRVDLDINSAAETLKDLLPNQIKREVDIPRIQEVVAEYYKLDIPSLSAKRRDQEVAFPRQIAMYLCRTVKDYSYPQIGDAFGGRNHTTVMHACDKISEQLRNDEALTGVIEDLKKRLYD